MMNKTTIQGKKKNQEQTIAEKYDGVLVGTNSKYRHNREEVEDVMKKLKKNPENHK